jgi:PilZ domain
MATAGLASSGSGAGGGKTVSGRDKRVDERFALERAPGTLIHKGTSIPCEMVDVSLSGCRLRTLQPFTEGALESVKVVLTIQGMVLSIWGITQWTQGDRMIGVRFIHPTGRTRNQLAGLLTCLLDTSAVEVVMKAVAAAAGEAGSAIIALKHPLPVEPKTHPEPEIADTLEEEEFQQAPPLPPPRQRPQLKSEHKVLIMEVGESPAVLHLVAEESILGGNVMDVSQDGCLVLLAKPFAVRLNAQVEVDFHLRGLQFRLPGKTKEMHGDQIVEIPFAEMSMRKRDDLSLVIHELIEDSKAAGSAG